MSRQIKIGIMGGTFNPIHNGHIILAQTAYDELGLDKVLFMPSGNSYMKKNVLDTQKRVDMVKLAIEPYTYFEISEVETKRDGNTYTYETLEILKQENPDTEYYFIIGADSLFNIEKWKEPHKIFKLCTLVCAVRDDYDMEQIKKRGIQLSETGAKVVYLNISKIQISSTDIREHASKGQSIEGMVPEKVSEYIRQEKLYYEKD